MAAIALPKDILETDLSYPKINYARSKNRVEKTLTLHYTERFGWCVATLFIRSAGRRNPGRQDRTYAYTLNGQVVTIGIGPHILRTIRVHVTTNTAKRLAKYVELETKGEAAAGDIRDRISTRRAQSSGRRSYFGWL